MLVCRKKKAKLVKGTMIEHRRHFGRLFRVRTQDSDIQRKSRWNVWRGQSETTQAMFMSRSQVQAQPLLRHKT